MFWRIARKYNIRPPVNSLTAFRTRNLCRLGICKFTALCFSKVFPRHQFHLLTPFRLRLGLLGLRYSKVCRCFINRAICIMSFVKPPIIFCFAPLVFLQIIIGILEYKCLCLSNYHHSLLSPLFDKIIIEHISFEFYRLTADRAKSVLVAVL